MMRSLSSSLPIRPEKLSKDRFISVSACKTWLQSIACSLRLNSDLRAEISPSLSMIFFILWPIFERNGIILELVKKCSTFLPVLPVVVTTSLRKVSHSISSSTSSASYKISLSIWSQSRILSFFDCCFSASDSTTLMAFNLSSRVQGHLQVPMPNEVLEQQKSPTSLKGILQYRLQKLLPFSFWVRGGVFDREKMIEIRVEFRFLSGEEKSLSLLN